MRTLYTLFALLSLVLVAAAAQATIHMTCSGGFGGGFCNGPEFVAANLHDGTTYVIELTNSTTGETLEFPDLTVSPGITPVGGAFDVIDFTFLDPGTWLCELHAVGNNRNPHNHALATDTLGF